MPELDNIFEPELDNIFEPELDPAEVNRLEFEQDEELNSWEHRPSTLVQGELPQAIDTNAAPPEEILEFEKVFSQEDLSAYEAIKALPSVGERRFGDKPSDWLTETLYDGVPTFTDYKNGNSRGLLKSLKDGIVKTAGQLKDAGLSIKEVGLSPDAMRLGVVEGFSDSFADTIEGTAQFVTGDTANPVRRAIGDFFDPFGAIARMIANEGNEPDQRKYELRDYQKQVEQWQRMKRTQGELSKVAQERGLSEGLLDQAPSLAAFFASSEKQEKALQDQAGGFAIVADPLNFLPGVGAGARGAKLATMAEKLTVTPTRMARFREKLDLFTKAPLASSLQATGAAFSKGGVFGGKMARSDVLTAGEVINRGRHYIGDLLEVAGRITRKPTRLGALQASFQANTAAGRALASFVVTNKFPMGMLLWTANKSKHLGERGIRAGLAGAATNGAMGYLGSGTGEVEALGEGAGSGLAAGGAIGGISSLFTKSHTSMDLTNEWLSTRPIDEQRLLRGKLDDDGLQRLAQSSTLIGGYQTDVIRDISERYLDAPSYAKEVVDRGLDYLPRSWTREQRYEHMAKHGKGMMLPGNDEYRQPVMLMNMDAPDALNNVFQSQAVALTRLQLPDPNPEKGRKLKLELDREHGEGWAVEQLTEVNRAKYNEVMGDPLAWRRAALEDHWFGKGGVLKDDATMSRIYQEYHGARGFEVRSANNLQADKAQVVRWEDLDVRQREAFQAEAVDHILGQRLGQALGKATNAKETWDFGRDLQLKHPKLGAAATEFALQHLTAGMANRVRRGAFSVTKIRDPLMLENDLLQSILGAKAKANAGRNLAAKRPKKSRGGSPPEETSSSGGTELSDLGGNELSDLGGNELLAGYNFDFDEAKAGIATSLQEQSFASGLLDEFHFEKRGEALRSTADSLAIEADYQSEAIVSALGAMPEELQRKVASDPYHVRYKGGQSVEGKYFSPDQMGALMTYVRPDIMALQRTTGLSSEEASKSGAALAARNIPDPSKTRIPLNRLVRTIDRLNQEMWSNLAPGSWAERPLEPIDLQYFEPRMQASDRSRVLNRFLPAIGANMTRESVLPIGWASSKAKGLVLRAVDMIGLEEAAREKLPEGFSTFDEWREASLRVIRGETTNAKLSDFFAPHIREYKASRIGEIVRTGDLVPETPP